MVWRCVGPVGWLLKNDRLNNMSCKEIMKVHGLVSINKAKWEFVEQQKGLGLWVTVKY